MKSLWQTIALLFASSTAFIAIMSVINIIFDWDLGLRSGTSTLPLPTTWEELIFLTIVLFIVAGLFWLIGYTGDLLHTIRKSPVASLSILATLTALAIIGGNFALTWIMGGPLQRAIEMGNTNRVVELTQTQNYSPADLSSPLYFALDRNNLTMAEALLEAGADPNAVGDDTYQTPLLLSSVRYFSEDAVTLLLEKGANPNATDSVGRTAMIMAISYRDRAYPNNNLPKLLIALHAAGGDPTLAGDNGLTPLAIAKNRDFEATVLTLEAMTE